jgi:hypothetical protein
LPASSSQLPMVGRAKDSPLVTGNWQLATGDFFLQ